MKLLTANDYKGMLNRVGVNLSINGASLYLKVFSLREKTTATVTVEVDAGSSMSTRGVSYLVDGLDEITEKLKTQLLAMLQREGVRWDFAAVRVPVITARGNHLGGFVEATFRTRDNDPGLTNVVETFARKNHLKVMSSPAH